MNWLDDCINNYYDWLRQKTISWTDDVTGWSVVNTPFYGMFNDSIEIYVKRIEDDKLLLSDDGITLLNLSQIGVNFSHSAKRKEWLNSIIRNYGLSLSKENEINAVATMATFPQVKHNILCAIMDLSEMEMLAKHTVSTMFYEDVKSYLIKDRRIAATPQFIMRGKTGIDFSFDFHLAGIESELVIKTFNVLNKINVPHFLFSIDDVGRERENISGKRLNSIAIINDDNRTINKDLVAALESRNTKCLYWGQRDSLNFQESLIAA